MPYSEMHRYESVRTDEEWDYLFHRATIGEVLEVLREIERRGSADPTSADLGRDLQRITKARLNAGNREVQR
jgi:hypothetical protein